MIYSVESHYREVIDSLKAQIFDIEHGENSVEKESSIYNQYYDELEELEIQRFHARNKLIISIYSICEASLAGICTHYHVPLVHSSQNSPTKDFYLKDYLFSLGVDYTAKNKEISPYVVYHAIRPLRNYLTHSQGNNNLASEVINKMKSVGFDNIVNYSGVIQIESEKLIIKIMSYCNDMLVLSENLARNNFN